MTERWRELLMKDHETTERVFAAAEKAFAAPGGPSPGLVANLRAYLVDYVETLPWRAPVRRLLIESRR